jgi:hypothetical protein
VIEDEQTSWLSDSEIAAVEVRKQSELEAGVKQSTGGWPLRI